MQFAKYTPKIIEHGEQLEEFTFDENDEIYIIHSIDDDMYQLSSILSSCKSKLNDNDWMNHPDTIELRKSTEMSLLHTKGNNIQLIKYKSDCSPQFKGIYVHKALVGPISFSISTLYASYINQLLDCIEKIKFERQFENLKNYVQSLEPKTVPEQLVGTHFYMLVFEERPEKLNIRNHPLLPGFVRLQKKNGEMNKHENRYNYQTRFFRVENVTCNSLFHTQVIVPYLKQLFFAGDLISFDRYIDIRRELLPLLKIYLQQFFAIKSNQ